MPKSPNYRQVIWLDKETTLKVMQLSSQLGLADNVTIALILKKALDKQELIDEVIADLRKNISIEGISYYLTCEFCGQKFGNRELLFLHYKDHIKQFRQKQQ